MAGANGADGSGDGYLAYLSRQLNDLGLAHDRQFFAQVLRLKESAERAAHDARERLIDVAVALCPAWVDDLSEADPVGVRRLPAAEIAAAIVAQVGRRVMALEWRALPETEQDVAALRQAVADLREAKARLMDRVAHLEVENAQLTATALPERDAEIARLRDEIAALRSEKQTLNAGLPVPVNSISMCEAIAASPATPGAQSIVVPPAVTDVARSDPASVPGDPQEQARSPAWLPERASPAALLLRLVVEGESRKPRLRAALAGALGLSERTGSVLGAFDALEAAGLAERVTVALAGSPLLFLPTGAGLAAYRALFGAPPAVAPVRALLKRHRTPEHTYLNLETADLLRQLGCRVELLPPEQRDAKGRFCPDLCAATPTGAVVHIEVETGHTGRAIAEGARKWEVIADHCGGQVRAVCASEAALRQVKSEVTFLSRRYTGRLDVKAGVYDAMAKAAGPGATLDDLWTWRRAFEAGGGRERR